MGKSKIIVKRSVIPLWEVNLLLIIGGGRDDIMKQAVERKCERDVIDEINRDNLSPKTAAGGAYFCKSTANAIMWFPNKRIPPAILAHEATHIVDGVFEYVGAVREYEARAYTVEWIMANVPLMISG